MMRDGLTKYRRVNSTFKNMRRELFTHAHVLENASFMLIVRKYLGRLGLSVDTDSRDRAYRFEYEIRR